MGHIDHHGRVLAVEEGALGQGLQSPTRLKLFNQGRPHVGGGGQAVWVGGDTGQGGTLLHQLLKDHPKFTGIVEGDKIGSKPHPRVNGIFLITDIPSDSSNQGEEYG